MLEAVADGEMSGQEALERIGMWADVVVWQDKLMSDAYHLLQHVRADLDPRSDGRTYVSAKLAGLRSSAERLRHAATRRM